MPTAALVQWWLSDWEAAPQRPRGRTHVTPSRPVRVPLRIYIPPDEIERRTARVRGVTRIESHTVGTVAAFPQRDRQRAEDELLLLIDLL